MSTPEGLIQRNLEFLESQRRRLNVQFQIDRIVNDDIVADNMRFLDEQRAGTPVAGPVSDPTAFATQSLVSPATLQFEQQSQEDKSKLKGALEFLAEMSGIPSIYRTAVSILPGPLESRVRGAGLDPRRATTSDYLVTGITVLGGFGVKGALALIRGAGKALASPVMSASSKVIRESMEQVAKLAEKDLAGAFAEAAATGRVISEGHVAGRLTMQEMREAVEYIGEVVGNNQLLADRLTNVQAGRLFKRVAEAYGVGDVEMELLPRIMDDLGIQGSREGRIALARLLHDGWSEWGKTGKALSDLQKQLGKVLSQKELDIAGLGHIKAKGSIYRVVRGATDLWRGSITAQLSTAMRNLEVGVVRMPLKFFEDVGAGAVEMFTTQTGAKAAFRPAFENLLAFWRTGFGKNRVARDRIRNLLQTIDKSENKLGRKSLWGRFFQTPANEVVTGGLPPGKMASWLNFWQMANRTQENMMRTIAFDAQLGKRLQQLGVRMEDVFTAPGPTTWGTKWKAIRSAIDESVNEALEVTFALRPSGKMWNHLFQVYDEFPLAATIHPFPRFFANSVKFFKDHSPFGLMKFATKGQRNAITRAMEAKGMGDFVQREATEALGKVMSGHMMLGAAMAWRNSDLAGERWYEVKTPGGKIIDLRPFNPLAAYMLLAERMKQIGDPDAPSVPLKLRDFIEAFAGIRRFTGTGLFIFNLFDSDLEAFERGLERTAAEMVGGFTIPFRQFKDILATVVPDEAVFRAKDVGGIFGPAIANLPLAGTLGAQPAEPRRERAGRVGEEPRLGGILAPATARQLTGLSPRTRTAVESELIKHDISAAARTGDPELNRAITEMVGPEVDRRLSRIVESPKYRRANPVRQREMLSHELTRIRSAAKRRILSRDRRDIVEKIAGELEGRGRDEQLKALRKMRNAGRINKALESAIARRLRISG